MAGRRENSQKCVSWSWDQTHGTLPLRPLVTVREVIILYVGRDPRGQIKSIQSNGVVFGDEGKVRVVYFF